MCVSCATVCLCSLYNEQSIDYFGQKMTFFIKFNKFKPLKSFLFINPLGLKSRHVCQLRSGVQFYKAVDGKSSLKFKHFSPDTEVTEQDQVIEIFDKPIMLKCGQTMLSKVSESHNIL